MRYKLNIDVPELEALLPTSVTRKATRDARDELASTRAAEAEAKQRVIDTTAAVERLRQAVGAGTSDVVVLEAAIVAQRAAALAVPTGDAIRQAELQLQAAEHADRRETVERLRNGLARLQEIADAIAPVLEALVAADTELRARIARTVKRVPALRLKDFGEVSAVKWPTSPWHGIRTQSQILELTSTTNRHAMHEKELEAAVEAAHAETRSLQAQNIELRGQVDSLPVLAATPIAATPIKDPRRHLRGGSSIADAAAGSGRAAVTPVSSSTSSQPSLTVRRLALPMLDIRAGVTGVDNNAREVDLVFSTGADVVRRDWQTSGRYIERLSLQPGHVRLDRLNRGAPLLNAHANYELANQIGVVVDRSARVVNGEGHARVRFSKRDDVEPIFRDVKDGVIRNVSVGYVVHKYSETLGKDGQLPVRMAIDWEPYEVSLVPMPADAGAQVRSSETYPCLVEGAA